MPIARRCSGLAGRSRRGRGYRRAPVDRFRDSAPAASACGRGRRSTRRSSAAAQEDRASPSPPSTKPSQLRPARKRTVVSDRRCDRNCARGCAIRSPNSRPRSKPSTVAQLKKSRPTPCSPTAIRRPHHVHRRSAGPRRRPSGLPFVGRAGKLLDKMLAAIGLDRTKRLHHQRHATGGRRTTAIPTRGSRDVHAVPAPSHRTAPIPKIMILLGAVAVRHVHGPSDGIMRLRGRWLEYHVNGTHGSRDANTCIRPILLRQPAHKKLAWRDLQAIEDKIDALGLLEQRLAATARRRSSANRGIAECALRPRCRMRLALAAALRHRARANCRLPQTVDRSASDAVLSPSDVALYRADLRRRTRRPSSTRPSDSVARSRDTSLEGLCAGRALSLAARQARTGRRSGRAGSQQLSRNLPIADRIYRLAVKRSTKKVRHHHHTTLVCGGDQHSGARRPARHRGGGYEEVDLPDPPLQSDAARAARADRTPRSRPISRTRRMAVLQPADRSSGVPNYDLARLAQRVAASYLAEGMDQQAYDARHARPARSRTRDRADARLVCRPRRFPARQFDGRGQPFRNAGAGRHRCRTGMRAGAAFWAARAYTQTGDPQRVITLLNAAAREEPTFYGLLAERMLGQDTQTGLRRSGARPRRASRS